MKTKLHYLIFALIIGLGVNAQIAGPVSITGTGTGGWNQPGGLSLSSTDGGTVWTASNFEIIGDGQMKISEGGTWGTTAGFVGADVAPWGFPGGTVVVNGGNNIHGDLGFWNVTYNAVTKEYLFTAGVNPNPVIKISGGGLVADAQMTTSNGTAYSKKSLFFPGGVASFNQTSPTTAQWGGAFPDGPVVSGSTITVPTGTFNTYFVMPGTGPAEYIFEPVVVSMIGNFTGSGWNADMDLTTTDYIHYTKTNWEATIFVPTPPNAPWTDTEMHLKIRDNHDWTMQYGCAGSANGSNNLALTGTSTNGILGGGGDIFIPWGTYDVDFNRSTGTWTFTSILGNSTFSNSTLKVYPNPTTNNWNFSTEKNQIDSIQIIDVLGKVVITKNVNSNQTTIDASTLTNGIYFAKIATVSGSETVKLVKK
jgi:hypothetical protein